jgi:hypothetical protein
MASLHDISTRTVATTAIILCVAAISLLIIEQGTPSEVAPKTGILLSTDVYTVTLINDTYYNAEFISFTFGQYTSTVRNWGVLQPQSSTNITLPVGSGRYVISLTEDTDDSPAMMDSIVTEVRLADLDYQFRFLHDNMSLSALESTELPPGFFDDPPTEEIPDPSPVP